MAPILWNQWAGPERVLLWISPRGREALDLLLLLLQQALMGAQGGGGVGWGGRTFVWALLRARNLTDYLKVSFGIRLEARVIFSCLTTPFYSDHLRDTSPECLGVLPYHPLWRTGPSVPSSLAWWPWWVSSALCPALDAVSVMLAKEAEDIRDRNRLLGLNFLLLYHPGLGPGQHHQ